MLQKNLIKSPAAICTVRPDRVQLLARTWTRRVPHIRGFNVCRDIRVHQQTAIRTYPRMRNLQNFKTSTTVDLQYWAEPPWLEPVKLTIITQRSEGLQRTELQAICDHFKWTRFITFELAIDFPVESGVDRAFVLRHGLFGRSHLVEGRIFDVLRFGTRRSATLVRAYEKPELNSYRVEVEFHGRWLREHGVRRLHDVPRIANLVWPHRVWFARPDWARLAAHLSRKGLPTQKILVEAQSRARSIRKLLDYLRRDVGLLNVHRFLRPLSINRAIRNAARTWSECWRHNSKDATGGPR